MKLIDDIDKLIDEYNKYLEDDEFLYKANQFTIFSMPKKYSELKDLDLVLMIKNMILLYAVDKDYDNFKQLNNMLQNTDLSLFYQKYLEHHTPTNMEMVELFKVDDTTLYTSVNEERGFTVLGIKDKYDANLSIEEKQNIVCEEVKRQDDINIEFLFNDKFIENKVIDECGIDLSDEDIEGLKFAIYNICSEIYDSYVFEKREEILFKNYKEICKSISKTNINNSFLKDYISCIKRAYGSLINAHQKDKKECQSKILTLIKIKNYIEDRKNLADNIDKINFNVLKEVDENAYLEVFCLILEEQEKKYKKVSKEKEQLLKTKGKSNIEKVLEKYKIDFRQLDISLQEELKKIDADSLDKKLDIYPLSKDEVFTNKLFLFLKNNTLKDINYYSYLINLGIIRKETLLSLEKDDLNKVKENAELVLQCNLTGKENNYDENILLMSNKQLKDNIELLSYYPKSKVQNNFLYLYNTSYVDLLDYFLENNIELSLLDNHNITTDDMNDFIKRTQICTSLGIDIYTNSGNVNRSFLLGKNFYCSRYDLDEYMLISSKEDKEIQDKIKNSKRDHINSNILNIEEFKNLERYKSEDNLTYSIDGILISRPKVMRNLTLFYETNQLNKDTILQSCIYNSNFNDEEVEIIDKVILKNNKIKKM